MQMKTWRKLLKESKEKIFEADTWRERKIDSMGGRPLPKSMHMTNYFTTIGKIQFQINDENKKLKLFIGNKMTFMGGDQHQGYFKTIKQAKKWVEKHKADFEPIKTMNQLNKLFYEISGTD